MRSLRSYFYHAVAKACLLDIPAKLSAAAQRGEMATINALLESGDVDQDAKDWALWWAVAENRPDAVKTLLTAGASVNMPDLSPDCWPLHMAAAKGNTEIVRALLKGGADVHAEKDWSLAKAAMNGHTDVVKFLLQAGADVHAQDDMALRMAAWYGHSEILRSLLEAGANLHARMDEALKSAEERHHTEAAAVLSHWPAQPRTAPIPIALPN
jgi:ankyrin repeat protein